jgi:hypothetical protein
MKIKFEFASIVVYQVLRVRISTKPDLIH